MTLYDDDDIQHFYDQMENRHFDQIRSLSISGIKSIASCELKLEQLNLLIGPNGAGKSNLISAFRMLQKANDGSKALEHYVNKQGGADAILYYGRKQTPKAFIGFTMLATHFNIFEKYAFIGNDKNSLNLSTYCQCDPEEYQEKADAEFGYINELIKAISIYHAHDTTPESKLKTTARVTDTLKLNDDFSNLPAFLYMLKDKYPEHYADIEKTIQRVAPFFHRFELQPEQDYIRLRWKNFHSDNAFDVSDLSDGTLRFIALTTVLLQPEATLPSLILLDEPELGLHPHALQLLAGMMQSCSTRTQIIAATQSVTLLNQFTWQDLIITDYIDGASSFRRLNEEDTKKWVADYTLGELWEQNWLGGTPGWRVS